MAVARHRSGVSSSPFVSLALAALVLAGCGGGGSSPSSTPYAPTLVVEWDQSALDAISVLKTSPPVNSRALGMLHTAMYDAWAAYDAKALGTQLGGSLRRPAAERSEANKKEAMSYAAYRVLVDLYPAEKPRFDAMMTTHGYDPTRASAEDTSPAAIGKAAAEALLTFRHNDGSNQLGGYKDTTGYVPVNTVDTIVDPNHWQPLRFVADDGTVTVPGYITPHWGGVTTFAIPDVAAVRPTKAPPQYPSPAYAEEVQEILDLTANLTDEQKVIAEYWKDGPKSVTPPGHWCEFAQFVSARDHHTLDEDVKMFFIVGNAVQDAGICCWDAKRTYDSVRPITAIRFLYAGKTIRGWGGPGLGTVEMDGKDWVPYQPKSFITPPFPEYTSGHSTFSAAAAEALRRFTGSDAFGSGVTVGAGELTTEPGVTPATPIRLSWSTFTEAADQAGMSRRYGGIHFKDGDLTGREMGRRVGDMVYDRAMSFIEGVATP